MGRHNGLSSEAVVARHGSSSLSERTNSPAEPNRKRPGFKRRSSAGSKPAAGTAGSPIGRGGRLKSGMLQVRVLRGAPAQAPFAKRQRHLAYTQTFGGSSPSGEHHLMACSSMVEPALDRRLTWVRFPTGQPKWTRSLKPEWRGSGLLTRSHVDRNHSRPPMRPVTVAAERGGLLIRWLKPNASSNPAWSSACLYPNWQRERVESAFSARSSRARHTSFCGSRRPLSIIALSRDRTALLCIG